MNFKVYNENFTFRPDDWLIYEAPDNTTKLPDVPTLKQDINSSKELPKPLLGSNRFKNNNISTQVNET